MLENASLTSENMDQSLVPELTLWRRIARSLKQLGVQHSSVAIAALYTVGRENFAEENFAISFESKHFAVLIS